MINFPVIRKFSIENYELYSRNIIEGISHTMEGGVHLIIGVNGLGKTTLLNALFRVIVGPKDIPKGDQKPLGSTQHLLSNWRSHRFFSGRVSDGALKAIIYAEIAFGDDVLSIRRKLSSLEVVSLSINGNQLNASQEEYEAQIIKLSNCADFIDFYSVIKYLVFFLEDRAELIWDYRSQFEMFRILFFDRDTSLKAVEFYDLAQRKDSNFRNIQASLSTIKEQIKSYDGADERRAEYSAEKTQQAALQEEVLELNEEINDIEYQVAKSKELRATLVREHEEVKYSIEVDQHAIYAHHFPDFNPTINYIFSNLAAGGGCLACGNESINYHEKLREKIANRQCPICDSLKANQENFGENVVEHIEIINKRVEKKISRAAGIISAISAQDEIITKLASQALEKKSTLAVALEQMRASEKRIRKLSQNTSIGNSELEELKRVIEIRDAELKSIAAERDNATQQYIKILDQNRAEIDVKMKQLSDRFTKNCEQLLAEKVLLKRDIDKRRAGQSGEAIEFPCFKVSMTSGVFDSSPSVREDGSAVSESQREFIDLAFRLSLIDVVTHGRNSPSMIVMETPEASLDRMFVHEASLLFRKFASGQDNKNVFLASTNLTDGSMIPALLGILEKPPITNSDFIQNDIQETDALPPSIPLGKRHEHIINLLKCSAPNRILKMHGDEYEEMFEKAVYPELVKNRE